MSRFFSSETKQSLAGVRNVFNLKIDPINFFECVVRLQNFNRVFFNDKVLTPGRKSALMNGRIRMQFLFLELSCS